MPTISATFPTATGGPFDGGPRKAMTLSSDIATAAALPTPLFRIPPFPGAKSRPLARRGGAAEPLSDEEVDRLIERAAELKVGGAYWKPGGSTALKQPDGIRDAFRAAAVDGWAYADPFTGDAISVADAIELCGFWRQLVDHNRGLTAALGFALWKRPTVAPLLWGGEGEVAFASGRTAFKASDRVAVWKSRVSPRALARLEASGAEIVEVEDGFIRSVGLGADCVPPLSIVVDAVGIYFDPGKPSTLELLLEEGSFDSSVVARARELREMIVESGISKYAAGSATFERRGGSKPHLLVPGQVEDDRSIISGGGEVRSNVELLRRVRERNPDAHIVYKPHPDVEAGHRVGAMTDSACLQIADEIVRDQPISAVIAGVDEVHVNTSLAGFEALLREKRVVTYGVPFFAGWGLTADVGTVPRRRTARPTLDELVAATLLLYPRYIDPVTHLPCPPEVLVQRIAQGAVKQRVGPLVPLRRLQGRLRRVAAALRSW